MPKNGTIQLCVAEQLQGLSEGVAYAFTCVLCDSMHQNYLMKVFRWLDNINKPKRFWLIIIVIFTYEKPIHLGAYFLRIHIAASVSLSLSIKHNTTGP